HKVYSEELKWVPEAADGREIDEFDAHSVLVCVENEAGILVGTIRVIDNEFEWLLEKYFPETSSKGVDLVKQTSVVEVSRNAVLPEYRHKRLTDSGLTVLDILFTMVMECGWHVMNKKNVVVTANPVMGAVLRRRGGAIRQIGPLINMDDGSKVTSYVMDTEVWRDTFKQRHMLFQEHFDYLNDCQKSELVVVSA
ncbi:GNAT family N-acetyltransferase, partial [Porticoccaceae bacterium]|nr:GNAT family N-acetyltransferase [Porticoccaceae bacterium]